MGDSRARLPRWITVSWLTCCKNEGKLIILNFVYMFLSYFFKKERLACIWKESSKPWFTPKMPVISRAGTGKRQKIGFFWWMVGIQVFNPFPAATSLPGVKIYSKQWHVRVCTPKLFTACHDSTGGRGTLTGDKVARVKELLSEVALSSSGLGLLGVLLF